MMMRGGSTRAGRCVLFGAIVLLLVGTAAAVRFWALKKPEQQFRAGLAASKSGDWETVAAAVDSLEDASAYQPHAHLLRGALLEHQRNYRLALRELGAVGPRPELQFERRLLGTKCLVGLGRGGDAEVALRKLAVDFPDRPEPRRLLAAVYHDRGAMALSKRELEEWIRVEPDNFLPYRQLAQLFHRDLAHTVRAIQYYRNALALNPPNEHDQQIREELGEALILRREYESALDILDKAQQTAKVLALKAECCWSLTQRDQASRYLEEALALNPDERFALMFAAQMHLDQGDPKAAVPPLTRVLARDPHDYPCRYRLARAYSQMGDVAAAEAELELMKRSKSLRTQLAELYVEAINNRPNDPDIREQIARVCDELGKHDLAARWRWAADACRQALSAGESQLNPISQPFQTAAFEQWKAPLDARDAEAVRP